MATTATPPTIPEHVELKCPECGELVEGPERGRGSAPFLLASHRYRKHGYRSEKSKAKAARGRTAPTDDDMAAAPVVSIVRDMQSQIPSGTGVPDANALTAAFGRGVSLATVAVASYAAETEENLSDSDRDLLVDYLSLSDKGARDVMRPLAKLAAPSTLNRRFGRQVVENVDAVASVAELFTLGLHWKRYFRDRALRHGEGVVRPDAIMAPAAVGPNGKTVDMPRAVVQDTPDGQRLTSPPPKSGTIVSAEMLGHTG